MKSIQKKIIGNFYWFPSGLMLLDSGLKFLYSSTDINFHLFELHEYLVWIGVLELTSILLFLMPRTLTLGFFLISCYWTGITFIGMFHHTFPAFPLIMQALFIGAIYTKENSRKLLIKSNMSI